MKKSTTPKCYEVAVERGRMYVTYQKVTVGCPYPYYEKDENGNMKRLSKKATEEMLFYKAVLTHTN